MAEKGVGLLKPLITIACRAGSKRLPNKHTLSFAGKRVIEWTFLQAKKWQKGQVVCSTDDEAIKTLAEYHNVTVIHQPDWCAKDDSNPKLNAIRDALVQSEKLFDCDFEHVIDLDATNPCRLIEHIDEAYEMFLKEKCSVLFSVTSARRNPAFNLITFDEYRGWHLPCAFWKIGHKLPPCYDINANIYIYTRDWLKYAELNHPVVHDCAVYEMPGWTFCDIDEERDYIAAERLFQKYVLGM